MTSSSGAEELEAQIERIDAKVDSLIRNIKEELKRRDARGRDKMKSGKVELPRKGRKEIEALRAENEALKARIARINEVVRQVNAHLLKSKSRKGDDDGRKG